MHLFIFLSYEDLIAIFFQFVKDIISKNVLIANPKSLYKNFLHVISRIVQKILQTAV